MNHLATLIAAALLLAGCSGGGPQGGAPPSGGPQTPQQVASGGPEAGKAIFTQTCSACHGPDGKGVQGLGKSLVESQFVKAQSDEQLVAFVLKGRDPGDPANTTGIAMPPRGGNPALTDQQVQNVIGYVRTLK